MEKERIELLTSMPIFGGVRADTLEFLLGYCPIWSVPANDYFFKENDSGDCLFVLESGEAAVLKTWQGQEHHLQTMKSGDCFGEMAIIDLGARSASVRALKDCSAIQISAANLYKVYTHDLKQFLMVQMNMGREVCRRLRETDRKLFSTERQLAES